MPWTERQHALLEAMGLRAWTQPVASLGVPVPAPMPVPVPVPEPARRPIPVPAPVLVREPTAPGEPVPVAMPAPGPAGGLGWAELRTQVANCRACTLCESRTQTVFGVGHEQAHWMVVGEAPGENEDLQGEPFVGAAGQLLDRMLAALNLTRSAEGERPAEQRVYIANTLKCRPPRNRNPSAEEMAKCEPFLVRQIELLKPRIILAMGKFAIQALLRSDEPVGRLRGRVHRYQGVPLIVTYHPAYLLRSLTEKARAWEDLCLAADVAEGKTK